MKPKTSLLAVALAVFMAMTFVPVAPSASAATTRTINTKSGAKVYNFYSGGQVDTFANGQTLNLIATYDGALAGNGCGNPYVTPSGIVKYAIDRYYGGIFSSVASTDVVFDSPHVQTSVSAQLYHYYSGKAVTTVAAGQYLQMVAPNDPLLIGQGRSNPFNSNGVTYYAVEIRGTDGIITCVKASDVTSTRIAGTVGTVNTKPGAKVYNFFSGGQVDTLANGQTLNLIATYDGALAGNGYGNPYVAPSGIVKYAIDRYYGGIFSNVASTDVVINGPYVQTAKSTQLTHYYYSNVVATVAAGQYLRLVDPDDPLLTGQGRSNPFVYNGVSYYAVEIRGTDGIFAYIKASDIVLSITGVTTIGTITKGQNKTVYGTVKSSNSNVTKVLASVYTGKNKTGSYVTSKGWAIPYLPSYGIDYKDTAIDFSILQAGTYWYVVDAEDQAGNATYYQQQFTVRAMTVKGQAPNMYLNWVNNDSEWSFRASDYDLMMVDWYCEQDAKGTYWAVHNWPGLDNGGGGSGYAGFQTSPEGKHVVLLSVWDSDDRKTVPTIEYYTINADTNNFNFGGEGTGKHIFTDYNWSVGKWYTMCVGVRTMNGKSQFAQWVREENGPWVLIGIISFPKPNLKLAYSSVFQEDYLCNDLLRKCRVKNAYGRYNGTSNWDSWINGKIEDLYFRYEGHQGEWHVNFDCDWGVGSDNSYIWLQSGGNTASNGKILPVKYTLSQPSTPTSHPQWTN